MTLLASTIRRLIGEEHVRRIRTQWQVARVYKRLRPRSIQLTGAGNRIFVNPSDERGWRLITGFGKGHQPVLRGIWHRAIEHLHPTLVVDVGVNYGEFVFGETYAPGTRILGVEANPLLRPLLEKSRERHPNATDIELFFVLASDRSAEGVPFAADLHWSGASTAADAADDGGTGELLRLSVPSETIDALVDRTVTAPGPLSFKIDVEGWEDQVMRGMCGLLRRYNTAVGIVEFNSRLLAAAGTNPLAFLESLHDQFVVHRVNPEGRYTRSDRDALQRDEFWIPLLAGDSLQGVVTDLVLVKGSEALEWLEMELDVPGP